MLNSKVSKALCVVACVTFLTSCGGDAVDPQTYAKEVCDATTSLQDEVQGQLESFQEELNPGASPEEVKGQLIDFLEEVNGVYDSAASDIEEAGVPDVEGGEEFSTDLNELFQDGSNELEDAVDKAQDLPTGSPEEFQAAAQELGTAVQNAGSELGSDFEDLDPPDELKEAFEEEGCGEGSP